MARPLSLVALLLVALVTGCSAPALPDPVVASTSADGDDRTAPMTLTVPALGVDGVGMVGLTLDDAGAVQVPAVQTPEVPGWYSPGVVPGQPGPAVVLGHVSGRPEGADHSVPGIFANLDQLAAGDLVTIGRGPARVTFEVYRVETFPKTAFPTRAVYGDTDGPELRLITCGGVFDRTAGSYTDNVVAFARAVGI